MGAMLGHFGTFQSDFGPQSKRLGPVWSLFLTSLATQKDLNGPKSGTVGQDLNILYWWRPFGAFWGLLGPFGGHFRYFWSDFRAQAKRFWHIWGLFLTPLANQNGLNGPNSCTVLQGITILCWWGPFGPFLVRNRLHLGSSLVLCALESL